MGVFVFVIMPCLIPISILFHFFLKPLYKNNKTRKPPQMQKYSIKDIFISSFGIVALKFFNIKTVHKFIILESKKI